MELSADKMVSAANGESGRIEARTGLRMMPTFPLLQGRPKQAGTVSRIPAREVETLIANAVRNRLRQPPEAEDTVLINTHVVRVEVQLDQLQPAAIARV